MNSYSFLIVKNRKENNKLIKAAFNKGKIMHGCVFNICKVLFKRSRLLWIGKTKNSPNDCYFALLPSEIIYNIAAQAFI